MANRQETSLYCGEAPMTLAHQFRRDSGGGFASLFEGRRVFWSFNTRVAIRAACDLLGLQAGDEILVPAYNCGSEVDPQIHAGLSVMLYPVAQDLRADPQQIEALITARTRAIYVTH
ncbi:MAG: DegT/DnrJ/EryC1/StrS family aminotransferase, partial [Pseudomonadota bacterium]